MIGYLLTAAAFIVWELVALFRRWTHVKHLTLSEYVWSWDAHSQVRRLGVAAVCVAAGFDLAAHFALHTPLTGIMGW